MSDTETKTAGAELREAAKQMRKLAEAVPQEWQLVCSQIIAVGTDRLPGTDVIGECQVPARAAYVASMHPGVALAVAAFLSDLARHAEHGQHCAHVLDGLSIARAYLGDPDPA